MSNTHTLATLAGVTPASRGADDYKAELEAAAPGRRDAPAPLDMQAPAREAELIRKIAWRWHRSRQRAGGGRIGLEMDLTACHLNGSRLDLEALLAAPPHVFARDIAGIRRYLDRSTGRLTSEIFRPRSAA